MTTIEPGDSVFGITFGILGNVIRVKAGFVLKVSGGSLVEVGLLLIL